MPWTEVSVMSLRTEFVSLASREDANLRALCRRFGVSPTTGYLWLRRYQAEGVDGLADRARRPHTTPGRTASEVEAAVVAARRAHPSWGPRKLHARLRRDGHARVPAPSTIHVILGRHGLLEDAEDAAPHPWRRFEHPAPNLLWQLDFKGHIPVGDGRRCHPLTVLDDHSRFALALAACPDERTATVQPALIQAFRRYGLPERMTMDNGAPWGDDWDHPYTPLTVWLLRVGVRVSHSRPYHPQTQGKAERFHRTLQADVLRRHTFADLAACQRELDAWRDEYNLARPHEALGLEVPASRYQVSPRPFPETPPPIAYWPGDVVRIVQQGGVAHYRGQAWRVGKAFVGERVALRPQPQRDGLLGVYFCQQRIATLDLRDPEGLV